MNRKELSTTLREHRSKNGILIKRICAQMDAGTNIVNRLERALFNYNCNTWLAYMNAIGVIAKISRNNKSIFINSANDIVEFIKKARSEQDVSQRVLAKLINVTSTTVASFERGKTRVTIDVFLSILNTFGYELQIIDKEPVKEQDDGKIHTS